MSYGNQRQHSQPFFNQAPSLFTPWSQQANQLLNYSNPINPLFPPNYPTNLYVQQQNNYYNSNFCYQPSYALPAHPRLLPPPLTTYPPWMPPLIPSKPRLNLAPKGRKEVEVICLDEQSPKNPVEIVDLVQEEQLLEKEKPDPIQKSELKRRVYKQIPQKVNKHSVSKSGQELPHKRLNRANRPQAQCEEQKKYFPLKSLKRKSTKQKFIYKFTAHEKTLFELSKYRQIFPKQIVTGPQFQARLPHLRRINGNNQWLKLRRQRILQRKQNCK